ncbi:MAG TPA: hypothetical protein VGB26_05555 [Nitrospiria bacterium]
MFRKYLEAVIPAQAGIQESKTLDSGSRPRSLPSNNSIGERVRPE